MGWLVAIFEIGIFLRREGQACAHVFQTCPFFYDIWFLLRKNWYGQSFQHTHVRLHARHSFTCTHTFTIYKCVRSQHIRSRQGCASVRMCACVCVCVCVFAACVFPPSRILRSVVVSPGTVPGATDIPNQSASWRLRAGRESGWSNAEATLPKRGDPSSG